MIRMGIGYDVHATGKGRPLMLGCVHFDDATVSLDGHSDADVVSHAICDALLGAAALGDIGMHFPDTDAQWRGADSRVFVRHIRELLGAQGFAIVNVDATVLAEAPRLGKHRQTMREYIAADLQLALDRVSVKATTSEGLGFIGRREGLACHAIALLEKE